MKLFKSKSGFTLIELLVVIGILAVLAAIAIPSVAGLIDRANVSADKTNANEMTNAIERFASEYELYCQDIASGAVQAGNLDSAQGRVYNVLGGAITRAEITALEKPATAGPDTTGRAIYRDTKYPVNAETMKAIVENYTKTSSSTFEPKQSDMHFWYSPDCGVVVYAEPDADVVEDLNSQILSGMDTKGNTLDADTQWVDLTAATYLSGSNSNNNQQETTGSATFSDGVTLTWEELKDPANGSKYNYDASALQNTRLGYGAFQYCLNITSITLPEGMTHVDGYAFYCCENLTSVTLPSTLTEIDAEVFYACYSLHSITIPASVRYIGFGTLDNSGVGSAIFEQPNGWFYGWSRDDEQSEVADLSDPSIAALNLTSGYCYYRP